MQDNKKENKILATIKPTKLGSTLLIIDKILAEGKETQTFVSFLYIKMSFF